MTRALWSLLVLLAFVGLAQSPERVGMPTRAASASTSVYSTSANVSGVPDAGFTLDSETGALWWAQGGLAPSKWKIGGMPHPVLQKRVFALHNANDTSAAPAWFGAIPFSGGSNSAINHTSPTSAAAAYASLGAYTVDVKNCSTLATAGSVAGVYADRCGAKRNKGYEWWQYVMPANPWTSVRVWCGMTALVPTTGSDTMPGAGIAFRFNDSLSSNWEICQHNGTTQACSGTGVGPAAAGTLQLLAVDCSAMNTCYAFIDGVLVATLSDSLLLPAADTALQYIHCRLETRGAALRTIGLGLGGFAIR